MMKIGGLCRSSSTAFSSKQKNSSLLQNSNKSFAPYGKFSLTYFTSNSLVSTNTIRFNSTQNKPQNQKGSILILLTKAEESEIETIPEEEIFGPRDHRTIATSYSDLHNYIPPFGIPL
jgi:hypothetical protein